MADTYALPFDGFLQEINAQEHLALSGLHEPHENGLVFDLISAEAGPEEDLVVAGVSLGPARPVAPTETSTLWRVTFDYYVLFWVLNESYAVLGDFEEKSTRAHVLRRDGDEEEDPAFDPVATYSKSPVLTFAEEITWNDSTSDPLIHYRFLTMNHILHVLSRELPSIVRYSNRSG